MTYSDFTLKKIKAKLNIKLVENDLLFSAIPAISVSDHLLHTLKRNVPLALAINTKKACSELIT